MAIAGAAAEVKVEIVEAGFIINNTNSGARSYLLETNLRESNTPIIVLSTQGSNNNPLTTLVF